MEAVLRFIYFFMQPTMQLVLILVLVAVFVFAGQMKWARRSFAAFGLLFLVYALPFLPTALLSSLESQFDVVQITDHVSDSWHHTKTYIVVLGAGHSPDPRLDYTHMLTESVMMRLVEGMRLYHQLPDAVLVTSASAVHGELRQAEALRRAAMLLGADPERIRTQDDPTNTCTEARAFVRDRGLTDNRNRETGGLDGASVNGSSSELNDHERSGVSAGTGLNSDFNVYISTSALHMRRAVKAFEQAGISREHIIPAPASFRVKNNPDRPFRLRDVVPRWGNVQLMDAVLKEHVGYWRGC